MNDARPVPRPEAPRARRLDTALVAQYLHELSDRHADERRAAGADPGEASDDAGR
jgi:hypothetical protein